MMETALVSLPLRNGTTIAYEGTIETVDDDGTSNPLPVDCTGLVLRGDLRVAQKKAAKLALSTAGAPTAGGSSLAWVDAAAGVFRLTVSAADSAALPYEDALGTDLELVYPSGYVERPLRITWTPDGEWTHG